MFAVVGNNLHYPSDEGMTVVMMLETAVGNNRYYVVDEVSPVVEMFALVVEKHC